MFSLLLSMITIGTFIQDNLLLQSRLSIALEDSHPRQPEIPIRQQQSHKTNKDVQAEKDSAFKKLFDSGYSSIIQEAGLSCPRTNGSQQASNRCIPRKHIDWTTFPFKSDGGLSRVDRHLLEEFYYRSESAFEFGVGESTAIAAATNLPRYVGVDSSSEWITQVRERSPNRFRFHLADVGPTREWGYPTVKSKKMLFNYQVAPLFLEQSPFDLYLVDGRFRVACVMASFLHAIHTGGNMNKTRVLLHDYNVDRETFKWRNYSVVETVATTRRLGNFLVMKVMPNVTEQILADIWKQYAGKLK